MSNDLTELSLPDVGGGLGAAVLDNHWEELEEWPPHRLLHACYLTMWDQPVLRAAVAEHQRHLAGVPGLDPIRPEWLHMTVQGLRFIDEVRPESVIDLTWRLDDLFGEMEPFELVVGRPETSGDSVLLPARPIDPVAELRNRMRDVVGQLPEFGDLFVLPGQEADFDPHISIAYVHAPVSKRAVSAALEACTREPVRITVRQVSMITLARSDRKYHWLDERPVRLRN